MSEQPRPAGDPKDLPPEAANVESPSPAEAERLAASAPESNKAKRLFAKGAELAKQPAKVKMLVDDAMRKAKRHEGALGKVWSELEVLMGFVKDSVTGKYRPEIKSLGLAIGALLYFLSPIDVIPDFIVAFGFLDDAAVIAFAVHSLRDELAKYRRWRETTNLDPNGSSAEPLAA